MLSDNFINKFIVQNWDFYDDDIVDYYINFIKSLSMKMVSFPIDLFYNNVLF
jgi:hypothetical protein